MVPGWELLFAGGADKNIEKGSSSLLLLLGFELSLPINAVKKWLLFWLPVGCRGC